MRILLTSHQFFPQFAAGTEVLTYSVARELMKRGHEVNVFTGHPAGGNLADDDRFDEYDFEGVHVYRFHHAYVPMGGQVSMIEIGYDNKLATSLFGKILMRFKPDVVHFFHLNRLGTGLIESAVKERIPCYLTPTDFWTICPTSQLRLPNGGLCSGPRTYAGNCVKHFAQNQNTGLAAKLVAHLPDIGVDLLVAITRRGVLPSYPKSEEVTAIASRLGINVARLNQLTGIVAPTKFIKDLFIKLGVVPGLITHSPYGIDLTANEASQRSAKSPHVMRIGFIGTLAPHKGCHVLIEAFKNLLPSKANLKIYGSMEDFPNYSQDLVRSSAGHLTIEFCGTFPNSRIAQVLDEFDVLVIPSLWYENTPLVLYSAQAAGCPVIASDVPGMSEAIQPGVNGLLFSAGNVAALTAQLARLIDIEGLLFKLSANSVRPKSSVIYVDELLSLWQGKTSADFLEV